MDVNFTAGNGSVTTRNVSGITDGYHVWNVTCWDGAGNLNTSNTFNFTRYTNPQVTLTSPDNNTWFNTTTQITLIYLPEDDEGVTNASLFINGVYNRSNSTPIINQNYNNFTLTGFSDNSYFWNVNVSDITGLTGIGEERRFYIDTAPPSLVLNFPNESQEVSSNNVSFNFTVFDNLAQDINCTLFVDEELESSENYSSGSNITKYATLGDGDHSWNVICIDQALNSNSSSLINFTVKAPPIVVLNLPSPGFRTTSSSIDFNYTPYDPIDITNCSIYLDGAFNDSNSSILKNTLNNFTINGIAEGAHNWTVNCSDSDGNWNWSLPRTFYRDISPPNISLQSPANESGLDRNQAVIIFSWLAIDALDNSLTCDVTIDGIVRINHKPVSSNISASDSVSSAVIGTGWHAWNATCWDTLGNSNTSNTWYFNLTYPDFSVNASEIYFNNSSPAENESVNITATVRNLADAATSNVLVRFYDGIPGSGGTQIGSDTYISLSEYEVKNVSLEWKADLGTSVIFVSVDESNSFTELNETNNNATKNISVGSWEFFYGNITTSSQLKLADSANNTFIKWILDNFTFGNVYITDYDAYISWDSMQAIGKTKSGADSSSDFQEIDSILNSSSYEDSVYSVYTNSGVIKYKTNLYLFNKLIQEIPIFNSTNNSNFVTGILWDTSKDTGGASGEFDTGDREDLIFVAPVNKQAAGTYGTYDYEIRVPAKLREYNLGDSKSAAFYMEIF